VLKEHSPVEMTLSTCEQEQCRRSGNCPLRTYNASGTSRPSHC